MFKLVGSGCHLYVRPGETIWSIANKLNGDNIYLRGGLANTTCPAHPSSSLDHEGEATNWEYYNYGVYNWHKATLLLRCPTHDVANSTWLVEQGREGLIPKGKVGAYLCQEDKDGSCLLADLNVDLQQEVAAWNPEAAEKVAHKLSLEVLQWLIKQRMDGHFEGKEIECVVWKENIKGGCRHLSIRLGDSKTGGLLESRGDEQESSQAEFRVHPVADHPSQGEQMVQEGGWKHNL